MSRFQPDIPFLIFWFALLASGTAAGMILLALPWYVAAFASANLATFALYGLDKLLAAFDARRVPERTLHFAAFFFGSPGALTAMHVFRHKTRKTSFQLVLAALVLVQVLCLYAAWRLFSQLLLAHFSPFGVN